MARVGLFIPNGNDDRSHRGTTLLALRKAGTGAVDVMLERSGHEVLQFWTLHIAARVPSSIFFVTVKIA